MITTITEVEAFFGSLPQSVKTNYDDRISRARLLFKLLGNPQDSFKSVHVAGTSGKGTTATIASTLLVAAGKTVGLTLSPHAIDIRERFQINNQFITDAELIGHIKTLIPHIQAVADSEYGPASYFEVLTALAFLVFRHHEVDYAVVEVGMGGTMDATNAISRSDKLAVITQIGYDHTKFLGDTLPEIATEKAGIIRPGIRVVALNQSPEIMGVFKAKAAKERAKLEVFVPGKHVQHIHLSTDGSVFNLKLKPWIWRELKLGVIGHHQAINAGLAIRTVQILAQRDNFDLSERDARAALETLTIPGRFDIRRVGDKTLILDGAHNQQKLSGLKASLHALFPQRKFTFLLSFKSDKELISALEVIAPIASRVIVTNLEGVGQDVPPEFINPAYVARELARLGVANTTVVTSNSDAFDEALVSSEPIVCTGSFYLLDELYNELKKRGIK